MKTYNTKAWKGLAISDSQIREIFSQLSDGISDMIASEPGGEEGGILLRVERQSEAFISRASYLSRNELFEYAAKGCVGFDPKNCQLNLTPCLVFYNNNEDWRLFGLARILVH